MITVCENINSLCKILTTSEQLELAKEILSQARKMHERLTEYHFAMSEFRNYEDVLKWRNDGHHSTD